MIVTYKVLHGIESCYQRDHLSPKVSPVQSDQAEVFQVLSIKRVSYGGAPKAHLLLQHLPSGSALPPRPPEICMSPIFKNMPLLPGLA